MSEVSKPEVGSVWTVDGAECVVLNVPKRGRGYQVAIQYRASGDFAKLRLRDFAKLAKAA